MVGSAIVRRLNALGYSNIVVRTTPNSTCATRLR